MFYFIISLCFLLLFINVSVSLDTTTTTSAKTLSFLEDANIPTLKNYSHNQSSLDDITTPSLKPYSNSLEEEKPQISDNSAKALSSLEDNKLAITPNKRSKKLKKSDEIKISSSETSSNSVNEKNIQILKNSSKASSYLEDSKLSTTNSKRSKKSNAKTDSSSDYSEDYDDAEDYEVIDDTENGGGGVGGAAARNATRQRQIYVMKREGITYAWGRWGKWSRCSNSCVQIRKRQCVKRTQNSTLSQANEITFYPDLAAETTGCHGIIKKYRLCKDDKCMKYTNRQMRNEQCSAYNRVPHKGKFYNWLGYEKEHNECELYCKPVDSDVVIISMNQSVTDGTPCGKPSIFYTHYYRRKAVCVEGICKAVHSSGAIRPATTKDSQDKCGSVLCRKVSEIFSQSKLNHGYHFITTIPAGAMNLTIKQLAKSNNLIALKTTDDIYIINGNSKASEGGIFLYDDDTYDYNKEGSVIIAKGPLRKPVKLMLLVHGLNPGVSYTYTLPVPSATITEPEELQSQWNELGQPLDEIDDNLIKGSAAASQIIRAKDKKKRRFSWELLGFGECNKSCGPGMQLPIFRCVKDAAAKDSLTRYYTPKRCAFVEKPQFSEDIYHCNRGLCPAYWRPMEYGECVCSEGATDGVRSRKVQCVQEQASGIIEEVEEKKCGTEKLPDLKETCNCHLMAKRKIYARNPDNPPKMYAKLIGSPGAVRNVVMGKRHLNNTTLSPSLRRFHRDDKAGVWLMSDWNKQCSKDCNINYDHRTIYCDRTAPYTDLCDSRLQPDQKRSCLSRSQSCRKGSWFTSDWSNCTGECFKLQRTRMVLCIMDGYVVDVSHCEESAKPLDVTNCTKKDAEFCGPKWHYSEWSECSRTCGEGVQRRYAKCLEFDWKQNAMIESHKCKYMEREPVYGACNLPKCEELNKIHHHQQHQHKQKQQHQKTIAAATGTGASGGVGNGVDHHQQQKQQHQKTLAASAGTGAGGGVGNKVDMEQLQNDEDDYYTDNEDDNADEVDNGVESDKNGHDKYKHIRDLAAGKEKLVIASAPKSLRNCNDELNNCKRINRERLCKLEFYKTYCCLTCHGYY